MKTEQQITKNIMRRVYGVYFMRQLWKPSTRLAAFFAVFAVVASSVSMPNVIANALHTSNFTAFALSAISNTTIYVQLGVLIAGLIVISTLVEAVRPRSHAEMYA